MLLAFLAVVAGIVLLAYVIYVMRRDSITVEEPTVIDEPTSIDSLGEFMVEMGVPVPRAMAVPRSRPALRTRSTKIW